MGKKECKISKNWPREGSKSLKFELNKIYALEMSKNLHNFKMYYYTQIFQVKKHRTLPKIYIYGSDEPTIMQKSQNLSPRGVRIIKFNKKYRKYPFEMSKNPHNYKMYYYTQIF